MACIARLASVICVAVTTLSDNLKSIVTLSQSCITSAVRFKTSCFWFILAAQSRLLSSNGLFGLLLQFLSLLKPRKARQLEPARTKTAFDSPRAVLLMDQPKAQ